MKLCFSSALCSKGLGLHVEITCYTFDFQYFRRIRIKFKKSCALPLSLRSCQTVLLVSFLCDSVSSSSTSPSLPCYSLPRWVCAHFQAVVLVRSTEHNDSGDTTSVLQPKCTGVRSKAVGQKRRDFDAYKSRFLQG